MMQNCDKVMLSGHAAIATRLRHWTVNREHCCCAVFAVVNFVTVWISYGARDS